MYKVNTLCYLSMIFAGKCSKPNPNSGWGRVHQGERLVGYQSDEKDLIVSNNTASETDWLVGCYVGVVDESLLIDKSSLLSLSCSTSTSSSLLTFSTSL